jgi:hypothetical protein
MSQPTEETALQAMMRDFQDAEGLDINTPYSPVEFMRDLDAVNDPARQLPAPGVRVAWRNPASGHTHVLSCPPDEFSMRLIHYLRDRHGEQTGGSRALRFMAVMTFTLRCRERLDIAQLNWPDSAQGSAERKLEFLNFLLHYPVPRERQFEPAAIPDRAVAQFLVSEARKPS